MTQEPKCELCKGEGWYPAGQSGCPCYCHLCDAGKALANPMTLNKYQQQNVRISENTIKDLKLLQQNQAQLEKIFALLYSSNSLAGEVGEFANKVKKLFRDKHGEISAEDVNALGNELGDALSYIADIADTLGLTLEQIAQMNIDKLNDRVARGVVRGSGDYR